MLCDRLALCGLSFRERSDFTGVFPNGGCQRIRDTVYKRIDTRGFHSVLRRLCNGVVQYHTSTATSTCFNRFLDTIGRYRIVTSGCRRAVKRQLVLLALDLSLLRVHFLSQRAVISFQRLDGFGVGGQLLAMLRDRLSLRCLSSREGFNFTGVFTHCGSQWIRDFVYKRIDTRGFHSVLRRLCNGVVQYHTSTATSTCFNRFLDTIGRYRIVTSCCRRAVKRQLVLLALDLSRLCVHFLRQSSVLSFQRFDGFGVGGQLLTMLRDLLSLCGLSSREGGNGLRMPRYRFIQCCELCLKTVQGFVHSSQFL